jgi:hypothetical protein
MNNLIVKAIRIAGKEPKDVEIGELTWGDEEDLTKEVSSRKINVGTGNEETIFDLVRLQRLKIIKSIKNMKISEEEFRQTPRRDVIRINKAYRSLNEISEDEKSSPSEDAVEGNTAEGEVQEPSKAVNKN